MKTEPTATSTAVSIAQTYLVPDAHILSLIDCAGTGIAYWAEQGDLGILPRTYRVTPDAEARQDPEIVPRTLKFEWIAKRLVQLGVTSPLITGVNPHALVAINARKYLATLSDPDEAADADTWFDSDLADVVIQLAFFDGKVIFG